jgi:hypothetical protein
MTQTPARPYDGLVRLLPYGLDIVLPLASPSADTRWAPEASRCKIKRCG